MTEPHEEQDNNASSGSAFAGFVVFLLIPGILLFAAFKAGWIGLPSFSSDSSPPAAEVSQAPPPPADIPVEEVVPADMRPCNTNWNPGSNKACRLAKNYASKLVTDLTQRKCLDTLWFNESNWDAWADNPKSSALGIPQGLTGLHGLIYRVGEWKKQVDWGLAYIAQKYRTACNALAFWNRTDPRPNPGHWY